MVLKKSNSPYIITCDSVVVTSGASLKIEEGVEILMIDSSNIYIYGELQIQGTKEAPVIFNPYNENSVWGSIEILLTTKACTLSNVIINEGNIETKYADVYFDNIYLSFNNNKTYDTWPVLFFKNSNVVLQNCKIRNNTSRYVGEGLVAIDCNISAKNSSFYNIPDAIEFTRVKNGIISGNNIQNVSDDAIDLNGCENILINSNVILNAEDKGISIGTDKGFPDSLEWGGSRNIVIKRNLIVGCRTAISVKDSSEVFITNCTLYNNDKGVNCYESRKGYGGAIADIKNTIIANTNISALTIDEFSSISVSYSLCDTKLLRGKGNIKVNPDFVSIQNNNFHLSPTSSCIKAGKDSIDIGAFPYIEGNTSNHTLPITYYKN